MLHIQSTNLCLIHKPTLSWLCINVSILSVGVALCGFPPSTQATPSTWPTTLMTWGFPLLPSSSPSVPWAFISTITQTGRGRRRGIQMEIAAFGGESQMLFVPHTVRQKERRKTACCWCQDGGGFPDTFTTSPSFLLHSAGPYRLCFSAPPPTFILYFSSCCSLTEQSVMTRGAQKSMANSGISTAAKCQLKSFHLYFSEVLFGTINIEHTY